MHVEDIERGVTLLSQLVEGTPPLCEKLGQSAKAFPSITIAPDTDTVGIVACRLVAAPAGDQDRHTMPLRYEAFGQFFGNTPTPAWSIFMQGIGQHKDRQMFRRGTHARSCRHLIKHRLFRL